MPQRAPIEKIPDHLLPYAVKQDPSLYTSIDHASWRFILRIARKFFKDHAHPKYLSGLDETGISTERIPLIEEMDACLRKFGWRAVAVSGFIPPAIFLEFQSLGILAIACDMRTIEHIDYTPAPDIVHEAAGHSPIVADPEYRSYLLRYGEVARHAIFSSQDLELYEAIRNLSDVKENPASSKTDIAAAQKRFEEKSRAVTFDSEAALVARMAWWTVEYGLIGSLERPLIYGAGLLSSVAESANYLNPSVKRIPFSVDCVKYSYDITKPQPQLFVASNFKELEDALEEFSNTMSFRRGGEYGLKKALESNTVCTVKFDTGVEISGCLESADLSFLKFKGPCQVSYLGKEIEGQGARVHAMGFSCPIGMFPKKEYEKGELTFPSGIRLKGHFLKWVYAPDGNPVLAQFDQCTISRGDEILYRPDWGSFDLPIGKSITSVYGGASDRSAYQAATRRVDYLPQQPKTNLTKENAPLCDLYSIVRKARETKDHSRLKEVARKLDEFFPEDWLLPIELVELEEMSKEKWEWLTPAKARLNARMEKRDAVSSLIERGLS